MPIVPKPMRDTVRSLSLMYFTRLLRRLAYVRLAATRAWPSSTHLLPGNRRPGRCGSACRNRYCQDPSGLCRLGLA